jgi:hypothetical protein
MGPLGGVFAPYGVTRTRLAMTHRKPASAWAMATTPWLACLPRASKRRTHVHSRTWVFQLLSWIGFGSIASRSGKWRLTWAGYRYAQASSTRARRRELGRRRLRQSCRCGHPCRWIACSTGARADLRGCVRCRPEVALASGKLTHDGTGGQPTHRKSLCLGRRSDRACRADRDLRAPAWLGGTYTLPGELMVGSGLMFGLWALRAWRR